MTRPNEEADRLWIMASEQRRTADYLEAQAAALRPSRTPLDHQRYFRLLAERDGDDPTVPGGSFCGYCYWPVHAYDSTHVEQEVEGGWSCVDKSGSCAHIDHRLPVARRGTNELDNLIIACRRCNQRKATMSEVEFRLLLAVDALDRTPTVLDHPDPAGIATRMVWDCIELMRLGLPSIVRETVVDWLCERERVIRSESEALEAWADI